MVREESEELWKKDLDDKMGSNKEIELEGILLNSYDFLYETYPGWNIVCASWIEQPARTNLFSRLNQLNSLNFCFIGEVLHLSNCLHGSPLDFL